MAKMAETDPPQCAEGGAGSVRRNLPQGGLQSMGAAWLGLLDPFRLCGCSGKVPVQEVARPRGCEFNYRNCAWWLAGGVLSLKQAHSADHLLQPA